MKALILSGGMGTRLRPFTLYTPKPLLPVANRPFLSYPLALLKGHGVTQTVLCTSDDIGPYRGFQKEQKKLGMDLIFSKETRRLGTAGAIKNAEKYAGAEFFVFNGDILSDLDLSALLAFHRRKQALITIGLHAVTHPGAYGLVVTSPDGRVKQFLEKPEVKSDGHRLWNINTGLYVFSRAALDMIPKGKNVSAEKDLFPNCLKRGLPVYGFAPVSLTYWLDIGSPEKYLKANRDAVGRRHPGLAKLVKGQARGTGCQVHPSARVGPDVVLGNRCRVGADAVLNNCVLLDGVKIGRGASVENCVLGKNAVVGDQARVRGAKALGDGSRLTAHSQA